MVRLSGPTIVFGAVVVVALTVGVVVEGVLLGTLAVCVESVASAAVGAGLVVVFVVELPVFFFAFGLVVVCAEAIDPAIRNALTQKLAANLRYLFIEPSWYPSSTRVVVQPGRYNFRVTTGVLA